MPLDAELLRVNPRTLNGLVEGTVVHKATIQDALIALVGRIAALDGTNETDLTAILADIDALDQRVTALEDAEPSVSTTISVARRWMLT